MWKPKDGPGATVSELEHELVGTYCVASARSGSERLRAGRVGRLCTGRLRDGVQRGREEDGAGKRRRRRPRGTDATEESDVHDEALHASLMTAVRAASAYDIVPASSSCSGGSCSSCCAIMTSVESGPGQALTAGELWHESLGVMANVTGRDVGARALATAAMAAFTAERRVSVNCQDEAFIASCGEQKNLPPKY